jgi:hypothetical protein
MKNLQSDKLEAYLAHLFPIIFIVIGLLTYLLNTSNYLTAIPGDLGDARLNSVILEHLFQWAMGDAPSLWSPGYFYPFKSALAFSDNHFGSAWAYITFRFFDFGREKSFLGWYFIGTGLNFLSCYWAFKKLSFSNLSASIGAFVFAFSLPALSLEMHAQLVYRFATPLSFYFLAKFLVSGGFKNLIWCCIWLCAQFLCSIYLGVFLIYLLATSFLVGVLLRNKSNFLVSKRVVPVFNQFSLMILLLISLCIVGLMMWIYADVAHQYRFSRDKNEVLSMTPHFVSYFLADRSHLTSWVGSWVDSIPQHLRHEQQMFFGLGVWIFTFIGLFGAYSKSLFRRIGLIALGSFLLLVFFTISVFDFSIYRLILFIPGFSSVRVVSRIVLILLLPISILVSIGVEYLVQKLSWAYAFLISIIFLVPEIIYYSPYSTPIVLWEERINKVRASLVQPASRDSVIYISSKNESQHFLADLDAMILAQEFGATTFNGYSGNFPAPYLKSTPCNSVKKRLNVLKSLNVSIDHQRTSKDFIQIDLDGACSSIE